MSQVPGVPRPASEQTPVRRAWHAPAIEPLPALEQLTLQSPIGGSQGGFSFLNLSDPTRRLG